MIEVKYNDLISEAIKTRGVPGDKFMDIHKVGLQALRTAGFTIKPGFVNQFVVGESKEPMLDIIEGIWTEMQEAEAAKAAWENRSPEEKAAYERELASILITSGFNFEGYKITKYSGYVSGDDAVSVDRGFDGWTSTGGSTGDNLLKSLSVIRQRALRELREAALALDCNAVIGVDFDYITLDPQTANSSGGTTYYPYVFCVTANGTAVKIEKE